MKISFVCIVLFPLSFFTVAQKTTGKNYFIEYEHVIRTETINITGTITRVLHTAEKSLSWNDLTGSTTGNNSQSANIAKSSNNKGVLVYKDFEVSKIVFEFKSNLLAKSNQIFSDSLYPMQWVITGDDKLIDSLKCLKATCQFRGRNYEAWFAPAIPISNGPWKFGGLPGLIIEIQDTEKKYSWKFRSLQSTADTVAVIPATNGDFEKFRSSWKAGYNKMQESLKAASSSIDPNCIGCGQTATVKMETIEVL